MTPFSWLCIVRTCEFQSSFFLSILRKSKRSATNWKSAKNLLRSAENGHSAKIWAKFPKSAKNRLRRLIVGCRWMQSTRIFRKRSIKLTTQFSCKKWRHWVLYLRLCGFLSRTYQIGSSSGDIEELYLDPFHVLLEFRSGPILGPCYFQYLYKWHRRECKQLTTVALRVEHRQLWLMLVLLYRTVVRKEGPAYIPEKFTHQSQIHSHNTRRGTHLLSPHPENENCCIFLRNLVVKNWMHYRHSKYRGNTRYISTTVFRYRLWQPFLSVVPQ